MVENRPLGEALLRRAADLALGARNIVQRFIESIDAERVERLQHPIIQICVGIGEAHVPYEFARRIKRIGDGTAGFHKHRAATGNATDSFDAEFPRCVHIDFIAQ